MVDQLGQVNQMAWWARPSGYQTKTFLSPLMLTDFAIHIYLTAIGFPVQKAGSIIPPPSRRLLRLRAIPQWCFAPSIVQSSASNFLNCEL